MLGTKSRWPGASSSVTLRWLVWKRVVATSTVTPLARSSGLSSRSQAQEKDALPAWAASFSCLCTAFCDTYLHASYALNCQNSAECLCKLLCRMRSGIRHEPSGQSSKMSLEWTQAVQQQTNKGQIKSTLLGNFNVHCNPWTKQATVPVQKWADNYSNSKAALCNN